MEERTLKDELRELNENLKNQKPKKKEFKIPFSSRISKSKLRQGYVTIIEIGENKNISFTKEPIIDGTIKLKDTFHTLTANDIFFYKGKPMVIQAKGKINPHNPLDGDNETYGQKYIIARMEGDKIITKKSMGWGMGIGGLVLLGIIIYALVGGG